MVAESRLHDERFRRATLAVVAGDLATLQQLLKADASLVFERSPEPFQATLLHYVAANGVEDEMQRTPANAVEICACLLAAGAEPDALAASYGGGRNQTPLCLLVSSWHPMERGLHPRLVRTMVGGGAKVDGLDDDGMPLATALVFGYRGAAEALAASGARVDNVFFAAGLGDLDAVQRFVPKNGELPVDALGTYCSPLGAQRASGRSEIVQEALHFAVTHGRRDVVEWLLSRGADVNAQVAGHHCGLPLLQALFVQEVTMAKLLVARGADPDREDQKRQVTARTLAVQQSQTEFLAQLDA